MANERKKIFSPEDFDKEPKRKPWYKKPWPWVILALILVAIIIVCVFKGCNTNSKDSSNEAVVSDTIQNSVVDDSAATNKDEGAPVNGEENANEEYPETSSNNGEEPVRSDENVVPTQATINTSKQVGNTLSESVSNDVEAEAMKVIRGDYGDGQVRKDNLGSKYQTIQNRVNELKRAGVF
ncbi:MAG: hypothetical protein LUC88_06335 [Prevotella sp.]|nr:hypothetical protein [Prevotella sp.]